MRDQVKKLSPKDYYVYQITVDGVIRYIGKGKGLRMHSHMKEVRDRLKRDFKLKSIGLLFQRNLTEAVMKGAEVIEEVITEGLTEKESYELEYKILREFVLDGKRQQLWNVIPGSIYTPEEWNAYILRLKGNLNHRDKWIRSCSGHTLGLVRKYSHDDSDVSPNPKKALDDWYKKCQSDLFKEYMRKEAAGRGMSEEAWYNKYIKEGGKIYGKEGFMEAHGLTEE
jgi:hypothetical protein